jgi:hypothetical protein
MKKNNKISPNSGDAHQISPYWIAYVVKFKDKITLDFDTQQSIDNIKDPVEEDGDPLIIDDDCVSWTCRSSKGSKTGDLNLNLLVGKINYLSEINPGDWVCFWYFDNKTNYLNVKEALKNQTFNVGNKKLNHKDLGLKFLGRVNTVTSSVQVGAGGIKNMTMNVGCTSFSELGAMIFFDPYIQNLKNGPVDYWMDFNNLTGATKGAITSIMPTQFAIPLTLTMLLGYGPSQKAKFGNQNTSVSMSPNEAYFIPDTINTLFRRDSTSGGGQTYANILNVTVGVQEFIDYAPEIDTENNLFKDTGFIINNCTKRLNDPIVVQPTYWAMQEVMGILQGYLNSPINEMFTSMRVSSDDLIYPSLTVRRVPLSTPKIVPVLAKLKSQAAGAANTPQEKNANNVIKREIKQAKTTAPKNDIKFDFNDNFNITKYLDLPRWEIDDAMINSFSFTKSNGAKMNFTYLLPIRQGIDPHDIRNSLTPLHDTVDIKRSGVQGVVKNISAAFTGSINGEITARTSFYNKFWLDINGMNHLKLTGTVTVVGFSDPIAIGDNCVISDLLFHIESVNMTGNINGSGLKSSSIQLTLTNGIVLSESENNPEGAHVYYINNPKNKHMDSITVERE